MRMIQMTAVVTIAMLAGSATAGFTTVHIGSGAATRSSVTGGGSGAPSGEGGTRNSVVNIMSAMYLPGYTFGTDLGGGDVTGDIAGTLTFGGSGITATRVEDFNAGFPASLQKLVLAAGAGSSLDQVWEDGTVSLAARGRYAGDSQYFGWRNGASGGTGFAAGSIQVFSGFSTGSGETLAIGSDTFRWVRSSNSTGSGDAFGTGGFTQTSRQSDNGGFDMMVAWEIHGAGNAKRYVLAFEDRTNGDFDYNDLVMELVVIPLPTAGGMSLAGLGVLALRRRRADRV